MTPEIKTPKITRDEAKDLKYWGFLPRPIVRLIQRHLLKLMIKCGMRLTVNITEKSFFIGFSVPLQNNPRLTRQDLGKLDDALEEIQYIIKSNRY